MRIREIDVPEVFQRLVHAILVATFGDEIEVVDDSGGDGGLDAYHRPTGTLYAIYCPEKRPVDGAAYEREIKSDLKKATTLREEKGYAINRWIFVTPEDLREPMQRIVRDRAAETRMEGICFGETHLRDLFLRHQHLHGLFPDLINPSIVERLSAVERGLIELARTREPMDQPGTVTQRAERLLPTGRIVELSRQLESGDKPSMKELNRIRLESSDSGEQLWATLITIDNLNPATEPGRTLALVEQGISLAQSLNEQGIGASLLAKKAWILSFQMSVEDIDIYYTIEAGNSIGFHTMSDSEFSGTQRRIQVAAEEAAATFLQAENRARETRCYADLAVIYQLHANALALFYHFHSRVPKLAAQARSEVARMRDYYETSLRIAAALDDAFLLARGYHNYANDLRLIKSYDEATNMATRAQEVATASDMKMMQRRAAELISRIDQDKARDLAPSAEPDEDGGC